MARGWAVAAVLLALVVLPSPATAKTLGPHVVIRVDQQGWLRAEAKEAFVMADRSLAGAPFTVVDAHGQVVLRGRISRADGRWSAAYPFVHRLDLSRLQRTGSYRVRAGGAVSPELRVLGRAGLYGPIVDLGVRFDQAQRDGDLVISGPLHRAPAHLNDAAASVYAWPHMVRGEDLVTDPDLVRTGGPVDVEGGWADAGDYLKFTHSSAYNDLVLFTSARLLGDRAPQPLVDEARYGAAWLDKMWDETALTLHLQVGLGSGNEQGTFLGDHDGWRLPQVDDGATGPLSRYLSHRPVFDAAPAGQQVSPNLAGRVAAAFALASQQEVDPGLATQWLQKAELLLAYAATSAPPRPLVTALPHAFYPESVWQDDMELGAAETARAARRLGLPAASYVAESAHWAKAYLAVHSTDTLNLYDVGALAHASLAEAMDQAPHGALEVTRRQLTKDLATQVGRGVRQAKHDPFGGPVDLTQFDVNSHSFGLVATAALYERLTGSKRFRPFATRVRSWLLGANPWGVSAMVGIGSTYPRCMQHQVANLAAAPDLGAVVNGPNGAGVFSDGLGGFQDGMKHCSRPRYAAFDGRGSRYVDDVRAWQSDEPALDMTAAAVLAGAAQLSLRGEQ